MELPGSLLEAINTAAEAMPPGCRERAGPTLKAARRVAKVLDEAEELDVSYLVEYRLLAAELLRVRERWEAEEAYLA